MSFGNVMITEEKVKQIPEDTFSGPLCVLLQGEINQLMENNNLGQNV